MIKAVFCDMDGTFVDSQKAIPEENMRVLDTLLANDVAFVPCTGRSVSAIPSELLAHPSVEYAVCCSGAQVVDVSTGEALYEAPVDKAVALELYRRVASRDITFDLFADDAIITERDRAYVMDEMQVDEATRSFVKAARTYADEDVPTLLERAGCVLRVNVFYMSDEDRDAVSSAMDELGGLAWTTSLPCNMEITAEAANKGSALVWLCDKLGVSPADVAAFGDSDNDLPMLRAAGDGVAMGNALPHVIEVADHVAEDCDHAGVARYLLDLLGGKA